MTIRQKGFTLSEILITVAIFSIVALAIYASFNLSQKAYRFSEDLAEINQNGRVIIERMNREIRQARAIAGAFPEDELSAVEEIIFEDGHVSEQYHYIHYFKTDGEVKRETVGYYFSGDPGETLVAWNAVPPAEQTLETKVLDDEKVVGEWVSDLNFWGSEVVNVNIVLAKGDKNLTLETKIYGRNF